MIITPFTELETEAAQIQAYLEITMSDDLNEAKERATALSVYNARSGKMLADAKYHYNQAMKSEIMELVKLQAKGQMSATAMNQLLKSLARNEQYLVDWIERINRATVHQIDLIRTFISLEKELLRNSQMQP